MNQNVYRVTDKPHVVATKDEHGKWTNADETL